MTRKKKPVDPSTPTSGGVGVERTNDWPIDPPGSKDYNLKGVPPDLRERFDAACRREANGRGRSWRWVLLTLMSAYANGDLHYDLTPKADDAR